MDDHLTDDLPDDIAGALRRLDAGATRRAAAVNPERVAQTVLRRLREEPAVVVPIRPRLWMPTATRIAAALAVLVIGGSVVKQMIERPRRSSAPVCLAGLPESLNAAQAGALVSALDTARLGADAALPAAGVTVDDLNEQELQALLATMEQEKTL